MKKQLLRVKQLADQTFLGVEKSEVLNSEELHVADQKIEYLRTAITAVNKKIASGNQGIDVDKRAKKTLEYQIGATFVEHSRPKHDGEQNCRTEEECRLFQQILRRAGEVEQELAKEYAEHEFKVEDLVTSEFQKVLDVEFPNIAKQKRNLNKYLLDFDSATNRYQSTKKEALKDDMEEADIKVEQRRDVLATEMFTLLARENEFSGHILQFLKLQRGYHESALKNLERVIPELEKKIGDSNVKKVFGIPLKEHLRVTGKKLAYPLEICISVLSEIGMNEEGILRMAGAMSKVKRLKAAIDSGCFTDLIREYRDVHVAASTLKMYLRELPEPLLTFTLHKEWVESMQCPENRRLEVVKNILTKLPKENLDNLTYLIQFLARVAQHTENKMNPSNLAIVMAPNLLWEQNEDANMNMSKCATINMLVEFFIREVHSLFPDDVSKYNTLSISLQEDKSSVNYGKLDNEHADFNVSSESIIMTDSPKPNTRKKKPAAPVPPNPPSISKTDQDIASSRSSPRSNSYPSGSTTLNRPPKSKENPTSKISVGINTTENSLSFSRGKNAVSEENNSTHNKDVDTSKPKNLVNLPEEYVEHINVIQPAANIQIAKAKPVQPVVAQTAEGDKNFKTTAVHQIVNTKVETRQQVCRPVAAPRTSVNAESGGVNRTSSMRNESEMRKMQTELFGDVQIRKPEALDRPHKPVIPARPASLQKRSSGDNVDLHKTQCSVYSVANKQQPSIVNLHNRTEKHQPGHDNQIAEKEKFLGHQPEKVVPLPRTSLENKNTDVNSNPDVEIIKNQPAENVTENKQGKPPRPLVLMKSNENLSDTKTHEKITMSKSNEKLNDSSQGFNGNPRTSHTRTRSDGNIMELAGDHPLRSSVQTPPSPRSLNKPTQPPPPPPININKIREPDSTDL